MPYTWTTPPTLAAADPNAPPLSDNSREWFPRLPERAAPTSAAGAGPGDADDDESEGEVGNIDPDEDEVYDGEDDDDEEDDTLWAGASSPRPPNRA